MQGNAFGLALKDWRGRRKLSQMELGLTAQCLGPAHCVSGDRARAPQPLDGDAARRGAGDAAHGTQPAAGCAGFSRRSWTRRRREDLDMAPVNRAISHMIERHEPYPAFVIDRHWTIITANRPALPCWRHLASAQAAVFWMRCWNRDARPPSSKTGRKWQRIWSRACGPKACILAAIRCWWMAAARASTRSVARPPAAPGRHAVVIPARYRLGDQTFSVFTTIAQFGTARISRWRTCALYCYFPADEETGEIDDGDGVTKTEARIAMPFEIVRVVVLR